MLFRLQTRKIFTGQVAAIVTRFDGRRVSYSVHPDRAAAFFHGKALKRRLTREYKADRNAYFRRLVAQMRAAPGWPRESVAW